MPAYIQGSKVDMILCNPPYFKVDPHSNLNESEHYLLARHEITTNLQEICRSAQSILNPMGAWLWFIVLIDFWIFLVRYTA